MVLGKVKFNPLKFAWYLEQSLKTLTVKRVYNFWSPTDFLSNVVTNLEIYVKESAQLQNIRWQEVTA